jgi:SAM-dependent methyltransferase
MEDATLYGPPQTGPASTETSAIDGPGEVETFYDRIAPFYHLIYGDWEASLGRQAEALNALIEAYGPPGAQTVLDVACGIGTQCLGLAERGYAVTASDLAPAAVERARAEAARRGLDIPFSVADMRAADEHHGRTFDVVIACDNAVPHLLTDEELTRAFAAFRRCLRPGGLCLLTVRDYAAEDRSGTQLKPFGLREEDGRRYLVWQVWDYQDACYDLNMYFLEDDGGDTCRTHVMRSRYYAVSTDRLISLLETAGFTDVRRLDGVFFQPVLIGIHP